MKTSFAIPTYNSSKTLELCLKTIFSQNYPKKSIEVILADGGSTDATRAIAARYPVRILDNPRRTGEAGKAVAAAAATGDVIALVDSDNLLPDPGWLERMLAPFADPEIVASEPWEYTWRRQDPAWTRYCALVGANDPLCLYLGNYDRLNHARGNWTQLRIQTQDQGTYLKLTLAPGPLPTIGANGFMVRRKALGSLKEYLFDVDLPGELVQQGWVHFAKVKTGIIHLYAERTSDFVRKQRRRVEDYLFFRTAGKRSYPWAGFMPKLLKFVAATVLLVPVLGLALRGYIKKPDKAWWLHPLACWITLWIYGWASIKKRLGWKPKEFQRDHWQVKPGKARRGDS